MSSFAESTGIRAYRYERPPFGEFGSVAEVSGRLVCHFCGRDFANLISHVAQIHGLSAAQYKEAFGLNRTHPLWAEWLRRRMAAAAKARGFGDVGRAVIASYSPEKAAQIIQKARAVGNVMRPEGANRLRSLSRQNALARTARAAAKKAGTAA